MAAADFLRGGQKRRRHVEHRRGSPAAPQTQREPAEAESPADVPSKVLNPPFNWLRLAPSAQSTESTA